MMDACTQSLGTFCTVFEELPDPRLDRCKRHGLLEIIILAVCATLGNADGRVSTSSASAEPRSISFAPSWNCPTASRRTTPLAASSGLCSQPP